MRVAKEKNVDVTINKNCFTNTDSIVVDWSALNLSADTNVSEVKLEVAPYF